MESQGPTDGADDQPAAPGYPARQPDPFSAPERRPDPIGRPDPFSTSDPYGQPDPFGRPDPFAQTDPYGQPQPGRTPTYNQPSSFSEQASSSEPRPPGQQGAYGPPSTYGDQSPYGQPGAYGPPTPGPMPGQSYYGQPAATTDGTSIAALVTGLLGLGIVPIVLGIIGLKRTTANRTNGRGMSIAGIILGGVGALVWILIVLFAIIGLTIAADESAQSSGSAQSSTDSGADLGSTTWLADLTPLEAAEYTTDGLTPEASILDTGALEAYTATYSDGISSVDLVASDWMTEAQADDWVATQDARFTAEQLVDAGEIPDSDAEYRLYTVDGASTLVATNLTVGFTMTGSTAAVLDLYQAFPY